VSVRDFPNSGQGYPGTTLMGSVYMPMFTLGVHGCPRFKCVYDYENDVFHVRFSKWLAGLMAGYGISATFRR
jgi:hypothetical protein